jgi:chromatin remodeling complex protein RSC6
MGFFLFKTVMFQIIFHRRLDSGNRNSPVTASNRLTFYRTAPKKKMDIDKISNKNMMRVFNRGAKVRRRPYYHKNHKIKRRSPTGRDELAGYRKRKRRWHRKGHPGWKQLDKKLQVSAELQAIIGKPRASRSQVVKLIWRYIRVHKLQKKDNGRIFVPDQKLARVVGNEGRELDGFKMMASVNAHFVKYN